MKANSTSSRTRSIYAEPVIPQWVSDMGLEWLYLLLSGSDNSKSATLKGVVRG